MLIKAAPKLIPGGPSQHDYNRMHRARMREIAAIVSRLASSEIGPQDFAEQVHAVLQEGHTQAWVLGRQLGGDTRPGHEFDRLIARATSDTEADYLHGFLSDIASGRYRLDDGSQNELAILARSKLYVLRMRGTANESFVEASPTDSEWTWHLGPEEHCPDCPELAALSPYTKDTLFSFPGDGGSACLGNCNCWLARDDGVRGFKRPP